MTQKIVAAAIKYRGVVYHLDPPARHHTIIWKLAAELGDDFYLTAEDEQGFMDSEGNFLDRYEAMEIAKAAGQILDNEAPVRKQLFSENVW